MSHLLNDQAVPPSAKQPLPRSSSGGSHLTAAPQAVDHLAAPGAGPVGGGSRKRYVLCGLSARAIAHFVEPLMGLVSKGSDFRHCAQLTAVLDIDAARVEAFNRRHRVGLRYYPADAFSRMIEEERPDIVLIAGPDDTHFPHIIAALEAGCDVIVEKPMVMTSEQARQIMEKERQTGQHVTVTFNSRYRPLQCAIKRLLLGGTLGKVVQVDFSYLVDTCHGSGYFLRWNRELARSGGLNVHKSCHHFDLLNWWLEDHPVSAFALGRRAFYGPHSPHRPLSEDGLPLPLKEERERCPYFQRHYAANHSPETPRISARDGSTSLQETAQYPDEQPIYLYDEAIDVEDTYSALLSYEKGAIVNYSINFSAPWEGFQLGINLTHGRIETQSIKRRTPVASGAPPPSDQIRVLPLFDEPYTLDVQTKTGSHGGADILHRIDLFEATSRQSRELHLMAGSLEGAYAIAASEAVGISMRTGAPVVLPRFE